MLRLDIYLLEIWIHLKKYCSIIFRISKVLCIIICFLSNVLFLNSGGGIECILVIMHSSPNGEQCGGPGFYPFEIHVFSILHNVLSFKAMFLVV